MNDLLFAIPWWLPTCIIGIGILLFISGNKRQQPKARNAGVTIILIAILLMLISYMVETDKEKVTRHVHEMVADVQSRDWDKLKSLLSPRVSLATLNGTIYQNREDLLKGAADSVDQYQLKSVTITSMEVTQTQTLITANMNVLTVQDATMGRPVPSSWQLEWEQTGKDCSLDQITCVSVANQNLNTIRSLFPK